MGSSNGRKRLNTPPQSESHAQSFRDSRYEDISVLFYVFCICSGALGAHIIVWRSRAYAKLSFLLGLYSTWRRHLLSLSLSGHFNWPTTDIQFTYRLYLRLIVRIQQSTSSHYVPKDINIIITFVVVVVCLWYLIPSKSPTINIPSICHIMFQHKLFLWLCPVLCRWPARWNILHRALLLSRQSMYFLVNCTGTAS